MIPDHLSDLMSLRAKAELESPLPHAEPNLVVSWIPERFKRWEAFDASVLERGAMLVRANRLAIEQDKFRQSGGK